MSTGPDRGAAPRRAVILSLSSDIGLAVAERWLARGWSVAGTVRTPAAALGPLEAAGAVVVPCDLADRASVQAAAARIADLRPWDVLVLAAGSTEPIGPFLDIDFDAWEASLTVNLTAQLRFLHRLLPARDLTAARPPAVVLFAGGGTNNATLNYSAYTIAKIASIKMVELLDAEIGDTSFTIIGPGWVATKIHEETLQAGERAGTNYRRTLERLAGDGLTPMADVLDCIDWAVDAPREVVSGRNFSVVFDAWGDPRLDALLLGDADAYRLRRAGNDLLMRDASIAPYAAPETRGE
ncbi:MAG: SDR family NAD(P)-dependent oxidoreductase [Dehalococcoidia bacterium]